MKKLSVVACLFISIGSHVMAQKEISSFFELGLANAEKLSHAYLKPYGELLGANLNAGWYTAASVHKVGGFDLTVIGTYSKVPSEGKTYDVNALGIEDYSLVDQNNNLGPTMAGKMEASKLPVMSFNGASVTLANGVGADVMAMPMIQASVGLPFHTEIIGRYMPTVSKSDFGSVGLWGIGIKHSIKEYIPALKRLPVLQLSILGGYTNFNGKLTIADVPNALENGELGMNSTAITTRLLIGANFPIIAFYTGVGYGTSDSQFDVSGDYTDPIASNNQSGDLMTLGYSTSGVDFNAGMRLRLGIIGIHCDYTVGDYSMITAGLGINFR